MNPSVIFLILCFTVDGIYADKVELQYIQVLFRHGDRAPIRLYPKDPNVEHIWPNGLAQLTQLGKRQHYALGKFLRNMYNDFITTNPEEVKVLSSYVDRCINSVECNLAAFYSPNDKWKFEGNMSWQPFPVRYVPESQDKYLETDSYCPKADEEQHRIFQSPDVKAIMKKNQKMLQDLSFQSGKSLTNLTDLSYLYDCLFIEKKYNLTIPSWAEAYWNQLKKVSALSFWWEFNSPLLLKLRAGPLLGLIIDKIKAKISGQNPVEKVQIYSAHDTNIAVVLHALKLYNMVPPPYCATLIFELYKINASYAVRLLYLNSSTPEKGSQVPHVLILKGCSEYCSFDFFIKYASYFIPKDWESECKIQQSFFSGYTKTAVTTTICIIIVVAVFIIAAGSFMLCKLRQRRKEENEYSYHLMPDLAS